MANTIFETFQLAENSLLGLLLVRLLYYYFKGHYFTRSHLVVVIYFGIWAVNSFLYEIGLTDIFYLVHSFTPPILSATIIYKNHKHFVLIAIVAVIYGLFGYLFQLNIPILFMYYFTIGLLLKTGYLLSKERSHMLTISVVYIVLAIDLFATMLILSMKLTDYNWNASELIKYVHLTRVSIFLTTLTVMHVKLRRFVLA